MQPESLLQSIQYGGSNFLLDIIWLPSVLCFKDACPYQHNLLEHCPGWQTTPSNLGFVQPMRHSSSDHLLGLLWPNLTSSFTNTDSYNSVLPILGLLNVLGLGPLPNIYIDTFYWAYHPYNNNNNNFNNLKVWVILETC